MLRTLAASVLVAMAAVAAALPPAAGPALAAALPRAAGPAPSPASVAGPSFSVMLWTLPKSATFAAKLHMVADAGYHHIELVDEYAGWDEAAWAANLATMRSLGITVDAIAGVHAGFADPSAQVALLAELRTAIAAAGRLGSSPQIILLSGPVLPTLTAAAQHAAAVSNLRAAAPLLAAAHLTGVIEPIDRTENPHIELDSVEEASALVDEVGSPHVEVLYDVYHQQRGRGNLIDNLQQHIADVALIHIADTPGRHAPGTGEIHYPGVYRSLARLGYHGVVAMEFVPTGSPVDELRRARAEAEAAFAPEHENAR